MARPAVQTGKIVCSIKDRHSP